MHQYILILLMMVLLLSCDKGEKFLHGQRQGVVDISDYLFDKISKYGGRTINSIQLTKLTIDNYVYSEDINGFQIVCTENKIMELKKLLETQFGLPVITKTNNLGQMTSFVFTAHQTGMAINCTIENRETNSGYQFITHLVAVKPSAL